MNDFSVIYCIYIDCVPVYFNHKSFIRFGECSFVHAQNLQQFFILRDHPVLLPLFFSFLPDLEIYSKALVERELILLSLGEEI